MERSVEITGELIRACATARGGWTKRQLAAIGVSWPPQKGWIEIVVGTRITQEELTTLQSDAGCVIR